MPAIGGWDEFTLERFILERLPQWTPVAIVTALPTNPRDGQVIDYLADATNGVVWRFKYRQASSSAYKWEFIGGSTLANEVLTDEGTASATYVALATAGPSITVPLAGDYDVTIQAEMYEVAGAVGNPIMSYDIGGTGAVDAELIVGGGTGNSQPEFSTRTRRKTGLAASTALVSKYKNVGGSTAHFLNRLMIVSPVRVG